jgi:hypothetical protein
LVVLNPEFTDERRGHEQGDGGIRGLKNCWSSNNPIIAGMYRSFYQITVCKRLYPPIKMQKINDRGFAGTMPQKLKSTEQKLVYYILSILGIDGFICNSSTFCRWQCPIATGGLATCQISRAELFAYIKWN